MDSAEPSRLQPGRAARFLALLVLFSATIRVQVARHDANFAGASAEGLLKSDPALLHYITSRITENGGTAPPELRLDPLVEHPAGLDLPGALTIGQEYLIAWTHDAIGGETPLHLVALYLMALTAAFLSQEDDILGSLPGYELLWRSPDTILQRDGSPYDLYRLYRLTAD